MTVMHVIGLLGCLENRRPVSEKQVQDVRKALDQNHSLRTKVANQYGVSVERLGEILGTKPQLPPRRR